MLEQDFSKAVDKVEEESLLLLRKCAYSILALLLSGILWSWSFKVFFKKKTESTLQIHHYPLHH